MTNLEAIRPGAPVKFTFARTTAGYPRTVYAKRLDNYSPEMQRKLSTERYQLFMESYTTIITKLSHAKAMLATKDAIQVEERFLDISTTQLHTVWDRSLGDWYGKQLCENYFVLRSTIKGVLFKEGLNDKSPYSIIRGSALMHLLQPGFLYKK
jgi:hypothetical protein